MPGEFRNEPLVDFSDAENARAMEAALEKVSSELGRSYDCIIAGERVQTGETFTSINPAETGQVIGTFQKATVETVHKAMDAGRSAFASWSRVEPAERAELLFKAAGIIRRRKLELAAWMVYEVGKSWIEADAGVAEAIDFLEFYGREMLRLAGPQPLTPFPGEANELVYIPLGTGAVIPPWNFPCAILAGMTSASFVAGNTVVLKPSSDAPATGYRFMEVIEAAGIPAGVVNYIPGPGGTVGENLVAHPGTRFVSFTGSKEVGLGIVERAGRTRPGQIWIKRVIAEMGGKDTIIVDGSADVGAAAQGVVASAFGYQGQKCSACSRAIVDAGLYDEFLERVVEGARAIKVGPVVDGTNAMGPVINAAAEKKILDYIEIGKTEGRLVTGGGKSGSGSGYFIEPTVFADVDPGARISQEEIFGPVLAVIKSGDFDEALTIANNTEYGLTGAVYTTNRDRIDRAKRDFHVGNLYFNRKCTGALVGVHPFGGFNMSGTDSKAGGRDYLLLFTQAKSISEKV